MKGEDWELSERGEGQFVEVVEEMKRRVKVELDDMASDMYADIPGWIESDAWENLRIALVNGLSCKWDKGMFGSHDLQKIALTLVEEHPSELQNAAIVELQEQVKQLRQYITRLEERR